MLMAAIRAQHYAMLLPLRYYFKSAAATLDIRLLLLASARLFATIDHRRQDGAR
jgi:hypothetical protein